jgi:hypothetical protein
MKRDRLTFVASLLVFGLFALALSVKSFADEKADIKAVAKDVKFACSHHGPMNMSFTLSLEAGTPQKIEFIGGNIGRHWFVKINDKDVTAEHANGTSIKVHSGDSITWSISVENVPHGVAFAEQDLAQALLAFDPGNEPLVDLTMILKTDPWKHFGTQRWGAAETMGVRVLASCKVK